MIGLKPRVRPSILLALSDGTPRCDRELMEIVHCARRPAQRTLEALRSEGLVHIAGWVPAGASYRYRPQYRLGIGEDVPHPPLIGRSSTQRVHDHRASLSADDRDFKRARRRQLRRTIKVDALTAAFFGGVKPEPFGGE